MSARLGVASRSLAQMNAIAFCKEDRELWRVRNIPELFKFEFTLEYRLARFAGRGNGIENRFEGLFRA
jgi:hypothetical protein